MRHSEAIAAISIFLNIFGLFLMPEMKSPLQRRGRLQRTFQRGGRQEIKVGGVDGLKVVPQLGENEARTSKNMLNYMFLLVNYR